MTHKKYFSYALLPLLLAAFSGTGFADQSGDLTKLCAQQQLAAHEGMKGMKGLKKPLTVNEFQPYCSCVSKSIEENATPSQLNELSRLGSDKKPDWFANAKKSAESTCLSGKSKITT